MLLRWRRAPWWVLAAVIGTAYGVMNAVIRLVGHRSWSEVLTSAAVNAVIFGAVMGSFAKRERDRALALLGDLDDTDQTGALRAARRGPAPAGADVRAAARRLVHHRLDRVESQLPVTVVVLALIAVACAGLAVATSPWWWLAAATTALLLLIAPWQVRRLRGRLVVLDDADDTVHALPSRGAGQRADRS